MLERIISIFKDNHLLIAGLGLSSIGIITFWIRDVPLKIGRIIKRQITTDLIITNYDSVFYDVLKWIKKENAKKNFRTFKLSNGRWGDNKALISMGYGNHFCWYDKNLIFVNYSREKESVSDKVKETIVITKLGRSRKMFEILLKDIVVKEDPINLKLYKMDCEWCFANNFRKRPLKSLFIEQSKKDFIFNSLNKFINNEKWYVKCGIPYQYGILLHGAPGTGKTSLIKVIASKLNYNIYFLSPKQIGNIEKAMETCSEKSIVVIEDMDTNMVTHSRDTKSKDSTDDLLKSIVQVSLSDILNSIDGLCGVHGRLLVCTTNNLKQLDKALIRPGRFDLIIEIGYVNNEIFKQFLNFFFPNNRIDCSRLRIKQNKTVADLQNMVLLNYEVQKIIEEITC